MSDMVPGRHLFSHLATNATATPEQLAIEFNGQRISYRSLHDDALALAGYMQQHLGVRRGDRVLLLMRDCPQFVIAYYAVLRCGAVVAAPSATSADVRVLVTTQDMLPSAQALLDQGGIEGCVVDAVMPGSGLHDFRGALAAGIAPMPMQVDAGVHDKSCIHIINRINAMMTTPPKRRLLHTRELVCQGFARDDGLFDIEGRMRDITAESTPLLLHVVPAGEAIHDMRLVMTIDKAQVIQHFEARTDAGATPYCTEINAAYAKLVGLRIGPGFKQQAKALVGGVKGCTHLTEMLGTLATTAMQTLMSVWRDDKQRQKASDDQSPIARPWVIDTCHAYRMDGQAVNVIWPPERRAPSPR